MWVWRPMDGEGVKLFVEPHVEMLAQEWETRTPRERVETEQRHHKARHRHHFHLRLHAAH